MYVKSFQSDRLLLTKNFSCVIQLYSLIILEAVEFWNLSGALDAEGRFIPVPFVSWSLHTGNRCDFRLSQMRGKNVGIQWDKIGDGPKATIPLSFDINGKVTWSFQEVTSCKMDKNFLKLSILYPRSRCPHICILGTAFRN
jgi:hypothetical protein